MYGVKYVDYLQYLIFKITNQPTLFTSKLFSSFHFYRKALVMTIPNDFLNRNKTFYMIDDRDRIKGGRGGGWPRHRGPHI